MKKQDLYIKNAQMPEETENNNRIFTKNMRNYTDAGVNIIRNV